MMILQQFIQRFTIFTLVITVLSAVSACGKKPVGLESPDISKSSYPQNYPQGEKIPGSGMQFSDLSETK